MKIAILGRRLDEPGGAEKSSIELGRLLEKKHSVEFFGTALGRHRSLPFEGRVVHLPSILGKLPAVAQSTIRLTRSYLPIFKELSNYDPDLIISKHELSVIASLYKNRNDCKHIIFLCDYTLIPGIPKWRPSKWTIPILDYTIKHTDKIIANSRYISDEFSRSWGKTPSVVYPFIPPKIGPNKEISENTREIETILHVSPVKRKGINTTINVAKRCPNIEFKLSGRHPSQRTREKIGNIDNMEYVGYVDDFDGLLKFVDLILMPSLWPEPYGMVPVEAGFFTTPTIAKNVGGLPESVGFDDLIIEGDVGSVVNKIMEIEDSYQKYQVLSAFNSYNKCSLSQFSRLIHCLDQEGIEI